MNEDGDTRGLRRYVGLDIPKHYCVIAGVDWEGRVLLQPVRVEHADLEGWLKKNLHSTDYVVIESATNAWHVYDLVFPLVERVVVANPIKVKQIAQARVKTDIRDTLILARLLAANLVPEVWVPPLHVRELRQLLSQRRQLVETHSQIVKRMHSVAHRHHLCHAQGKRFNEKNTLWHKEKRAYIEKQFQRMNKHVTKMSHQKPWAESMNYLMQLPGFGVITGTPGLHQTQCGATVTVLAAIGEIQRFESARHLASYSGLTPGLEEWNKVP
jgi:hypothetical protein